MNKFSKFAAACAAVVCAVGAGCYECQIGGMLLIER